MSRTMRDQRGGHPWRKGHGIEGDGCWYCISARSKRKVLVERQRRRERDALRRWAS